MLRRPCTCIPKLHTTDKYVTRPPSTMGVSTCALESMVLLYYTPSIQAYCLVCTPNFAVILIDLLYVYIRSVVSIRKKNRIIVTGLI